MEKTIKCDSTSVGEVKKCSVCGEAAHCKHFGALSCKSCAAFFRRAVTSRSRFVCRQKGSCSVRKTGKKICSSCRYERCLSVGMKESGVMCVLQEQAANVQGSSETSSPTTARMRLSSREAIVATRCQILQRSGCSPEQAANSLASKQTAIMALWSEMHTLQDHLHRFDDDFYSLLRLDITSTTLSEKFLVAWSLFETALATLHNGGQHRGRFHFVDHRYKDLTDSGLTAFFGADLQMRDLPTVVSFCMERYLRFMEFVQCLERLSLDDVEQTAFMQLLFAQCLPHVFSSMESRAKFINNALADLHQHYESTYRDYMGRLSSLLGLMGPVLELKQSFEEMGIFVALHSRPQRADEFCINHVCFDSNAS